MEFNIIIMCRVIKVDRASYYHWIKMGCKVIKVDNKLNMIIKDIFIKSRQNYGSRRVKSQLVRLYGVVVSRRRIRTIMNDLKLVSKHRKRYRVNTTDSNHNYTTAPNILNRDFKAIRPNIKYVGDITYIPTYEGTVYLATVIDLYSRKVVGYSIADHMRTSLVNNALEMAILTRKPQKGLLWHTDRGSQYASYSHRDLLEKNDIIQSMSRKGNCWDNAVAESFFHTIKTELMDNGDFNSKREAYQAIFEYIEVYYNRQRLHSSNDNLSPMEFEDKMLQSQLVA